MKNRVNWISVADRFPPEGLVVETKIDDGRGARNQGKLKLRDRLWFFPDDSMYVYYTPTHWRPLPATPPWQPCPQCATRTAVGNCAVHKTIIW